MSDECGYVPDWWKAPKAASLERKKRAAQAGATAKPGDTFLIVTEGTVTEPMGTDRLTEFLLETERDGCFLYAGRPHYELRTGFYEQGDWSGTA